MLNRCGPLWLSALVSVGMLGCGSEDSHPSRAAKPQGTVAYAPPRAESVPQRTTAGDAAIHNLNGQLEQQLAYVETYPENLDAVATLVAGLLTRTQYVGSYSDFDTVFALTSGAAQAHPERPEPYLMRAGYHGAVHEFAASIRDVERARELGASQSEAARATAEIALGGDLEWAREVRRDLAERAPTFRTVADWAVAEAALGQFEEAEALYVRALELYRDISPFPVAWTMFQRGVMWAERAHQPDRAIALYGEAVHRLPSYVTANVHLAELEWQAGEQQTALARLQALVGQSEDPEPAAVLAKLLMELGSPAATEYAELARAGYERFLQAHPEAFWDHAAEFFMNAGADPGRALELALANLELRATGRAYQVAIRAALSAEDVGVACGLMAKALSEDRHDRNLEALVEEENSRCQ
jgi:tetratricopeptide (TPR) repeat protein